MRTNLDRDSNNKTQNDDAGHTKSGVEPELESADVFRMHDRGLVLIMQRHFCQIVVISPDGSRNCGLCGDPYNSIIPRDNEVGGKYANPRIRTRFYESGQEVDISIWNNLPGSPGFYEFRLCAEQKESQACFDRHLLTIVGHEGDSDSTSVNVPTTQGLNVFHVQLPVGVTCDYCTLQWRFRQGVTTPDNSNLNGATTASPITTTRRMIFTIPNIFPTNAPTTAATTTSRPVVTTANSNNNVNTVPTASPPSGTTGSPPSNDRLVFDANGNAAGTTFNGGGSGSGGSRQLLLLLGLLPVLGAVALKGNNNQPAFPVPPPVAPLSVQNMPLPNLYLGTNYGFGNFVGGTGLPAYAGKSAHGAYGLGKYGIGQKKYNTLPTIPGEPIPQAVRSNVARAGKWGGDTGFVINDNFNGGNLNGVNSGTLQNGILNTGTWQNGGVIPGTMKNGGVISGTWQNGGLNPGTWQNGGVNPGTWQNGGVNPGIGVASSGFDNNINWNTERNWNTGTLNSQTQLSNNWNNNGFNTNGLNNNGLIDGQIIASGQQDFVNSIAVGNNQFVSNPVVWNNNGVNLNTGGSSNIQYPAQPLSRRWKRQVAQTGYGHTESGYGSQKVGQGQVQGQMQGNFQQTNWQTPQGNAQQNGNDFTGQATQLPMRPNPAMSQNPTSRGLGGFQQLGGSSQQPNFQGRAKNGNGDENFAIRFNSEESQPVEGTATVMKSFTGRRFSQKRRPQVNDWYAMLMGRM
ncbi:hypothetical protein MAR_004917 [Mya arenaria]|uniref:Chitin-binding type-4 domain-containing protein n=1 Tax=Mya arenaria TaxID=6604 RepID=A0ABY7EXZ6_MYAAR|nr:hypothetical protein MAR_004917 [Mya arenaria]